VIMNVTSSLAQIHNIDRRLKWKIFAVLMVGALVGVLAIIPYTVSLVGLPSAEVLPVWLSMLIWLLQSMLLFAGAIGLGLWLGGKVGLGAPLLRSWLAGDPKALDKFKASLRLGIGAGVIVGLVIWTFEKVVFNPYMPEALSMSEQPPAWQGLLASFYGGINEELLFRLGLMTLVVWVGMKVSRKGYPSTIVIWTGNILVAILFALGHLPMAAALAPLTFIVVIRILLLNSIGSVVFGWLYWQRGLLIAMLAHFCSDIVLHVIGAALI
jgi:membrane protease YdiL (CAAX protease family)